MPTPAIHRAADPAPDRRRALAAACAAVVGRVPAACAAVVGAAPAAAAAQTGTPAPSRPRPQQASSPVVLAASQDASIFQGAGYENTADGAGPSLWLSVIAAGVNRRALIRFDLGTLPRGTRVQEARLRLFQTRARDTHDVRLHRVLSAWGEGPANGGTAGVGAPAQAGDATWPNRFHPATPWAVPGGDFVAEASASIPVGLPGETYTWGPTPRLVADVQGFIDQPATNHGWILIGVEDGLQNAKRFESRESGAPGAAPALELRLAAPGDGDVPLPWWAFALLGGGVALRLARPPRG
jgi:hypothetical protein